VLPEGRHGSHHGIDAVDPCWSYDYLKTLGITQINKTPGQPADARTDTRNGMHDDIYYESPIAVVDPALVAYALPRT
jgi:hypothetical protein